MVATNGFNSKKNSQFAVLETFNLFYGCPSKESFESVYLIVFLANFCLILNRSQCMNKKKLNL